MSILVVGAEAEKRAWTSTSEEISSSEELADLGLMKNDLREVRNERTCTVLPVIDQTLFQALENNPAVRNNEDG